MTVISVFPSDRHLLHAEDGGSTAIRNAGILQHKYTVSWLRRPRKAQVTHLNQLLFELT